MQRTTQMWKMIYGLAIVKQGEEDPFKGIEEEEEKKEDMEEERKEEKEEEKAEEKKEEERVEEIKEIDNEVPAVE